MKKQDTWERHVQRQATSGMSKKAYCAKYQITYSLFFYHQRRLNVASDEKGFQEVKMPEKPLSDSIPSNLYRLEFRQGHILSFPEHSLEKVLRLLDA